MKSAGRRRSPRSCARTSSSATRPTRSSTSRAAARRSRARQQRDRPPPRHVALICADGTRSCTSRRSTRARRRCARCTTRSSCSSSAPPRSRNSRDRAEMCDARRAARRDGRRLVATTVACRCSPIACPREWTLTAGRGVLRRAAPAAQESRGNAGRPPARSLARRLGATRRRAHARGRLRLRTRTAALGDDRLCQRAPESRRAPPCMHVLNILHYFKIYAIWRALHATIRGTRRR